MIRRLFLLPCLFLLCCRAQQSADISQIARPVMIDEFMTKKLQAEIQDYRKHKDDEFKASSDSPIAPEIRPAFTGLSYYPINLMYRYEGPVNRYPNPQKIIIIATDGEKRDALKYGYILFVLNGQQLRLEVYKLLEAGLEKMLFVPFTDINAGKETYPAGRYIDLEERPDGRYVIDFNRAYNPSCAYGGNFSCPVTPQENHLKIAIPAGEKILPLAAALDAARHKTS